MPVDLIGDGGKTNPLDIISFEHWWSQWGKKISRSDRPTKELAKSAWNAALERAARRLAMSRLVASSVDVVAVVREFQVPE